MFWPWMRTDPESGFFKADDEPQQHALSRATASEYGQGFSAVHAQADPIQNVVTTKGLVQILDRNNRHTAVFVGIFLLHRNVISSGHVCFTCASSNG